MTGSGRFICGWCGRATAANPCSSCGRDSVLPWTQRGMEPIPIPDEPGRPALDPVAIRAQYREAKTALERMGRKPTVAALAEHLGIADRTLRGWRRKFDLE